MRYAQGGGLSDERRQFREGIRMMVAERFAGGEPSSELAPHPLATGTAHAGSETRTH
ncbi:hypothetical protein ABZ235_36295 [Streptomyces canus]